MDQTFAILTIPMENEPGEYLYAEGDLPGTVKPLLFETKEEADKYIEDVLGGSSPHDFYEPWEMTQEELNEYLSRIPCPGGTL